MREVHPWIVDCVVDAIEKALQLSQVDLQVRLKRNSESKFMAVPDIGILNLGI